MSVEPRYKDKISVISMLGLGGRKKLSAKVYDSFRKYVSDNYYILDIPRSDSGDYPYSIIYAQTPEDVSIKSNALLTSRGGSPADVPVSWTIEISSFKTPLDEIKRTLVELLQESIK